MAEISKRKLLRAAKKYAPQDKNATPSRKRKAVALAAPASKDTNLWGSLDEEVKTNDAPKPVTVDSVTKELESYFQEPNIPRKNERNEWNDPLEWWNSPAGAKYPTLKKLAMT